MAKKDFDIYVKKIEAQYEDFKKVLEQVSKDAQAGMTDVNFVENLKQQIAPIKQNYERLMYIKYLLDKPAKKDKVAAYKRRLMNEMKKLEARNSTEAVLDENEKVIKGLK